jgi:glucokinase
MSLLAIDLGGTKLAVGLFNETGDLLFSKEDSITGRQGKQVGDLISQNVLSLLHSDYEPISSIGVSVPGISNRKTGTVWAPNIPGWDNYPLPKELNDISESIPVSVETVCP